MVFANYVLILVLWGVAGFVALLTGVVAVSSLARQMDRTSVPSVRVADRTTL